MEYNRSNNQPTNQPTNQSTNPNYLLYKFCNNSVFDLLKLLFRQFHPLFCNIQITLAIYRNKMYMGMRHL